MWSVLVTAVVVLTASGITNTNAQQAKEDAPKTKLEAFSGSIGAASIKGYVEVGEIGSMRESGLITVTAMIIRDAKTGKETAGAVFQLTEMKSYGHDTRRSYVDVDELSDLLAGLSYIAKADETVTPMRFYEARYATRGNLTVVVFNDSQGKRYFSIEVGGLGGKSTRLGIHDLPYFWDLVAAAKEVLENPQKHGQMISKVAPAIASPTAPRVPNSTKNKP